MYRSELTGMHCDEDESLFIKLGQGAKGLRGTVQRVTASTDARGDWNAIELERRLLEIGFVEGASVEILHEGFIRRDPIAVKLDDMRVALRRRDAEAILLRVDAGRCVTI